MKNEHVLFVGYGTASLVPTEVWESSGLNTWVWGKYLKADLAVADRLKTEYGVPKLKEKN